MENFIRSPWKNYGICINYLWNISNGIKPWFNVAMDILVMGSILRWWTIQNHCGLNYGTVGLDFVSSGGQGGTFNVGGKASELSLILLYGNLGN